jgi:hypothetical protein
MAITRTPIINDDGSCTTGTIWDNAWKQELYNQIDAADAAGVSPAWQDIPYAAANYLIDSAAQYTVNQILSRWRRLGTTAIIWQLALNPVTVPAASSGLYIANLPFTLASVGFGIAATPVAFSNIPSYVMPSNATAVAIKKWDGSNWAAGGTWFYATLTLETV